MANTLPPGLRLFNWSGQACGMPGEHPCGNDGPVYGGWATPCGGKGQRSCDPRDWEENQPYQKPDSETVAFGDTPVGHAWQQAMEETGLSLSELQWQRDRAKLGLGPPVPGFDAQGNLIPTTQLSAFGYAAGGLALGAVLSAFVGYRWYWGAVPGAVAGYIYGSR